MLKQRLIQGRIEADALQTNACDTKSASGIKLCYLVQMLRRDIFALGESLLEDGLGAVGRELFPLLRGKIG